MSEELYVLVDGDWVIGTVNIYADEHGPLWTVSGIRWVDKDGKLNKTQYMDAEEALFELMDQRLSQVM